MGMRVRGEMTMSVTEAKASQVFRVLLIEDDEADAMWFERALKISEKKHFQLTRAGTLKDALTCIAQERPDIVITDLGLPDATDLQSPQAVQERAPELPIIVMTGNSGDEILGIEAVKHGAQDYLVKGAVSPDGLLHAIDYAVERKKALLLRDNFVHIVSHELRTPLGALRSAISTVTDGDVGEISPSAREVLEIALRAADRLLRTTVDLLDLSKIEVRKHELSLRYFDLVALAKEIVVLFRVKANGLALKVTSSAEAIEIKADEDMIARVLSNLLSNALKFTATGEVEISITADRASVMCSVRDTGRGIAAEHLPKLFEKFTQFGNHNAPVENRTGEKVSGERGTGLGLSICREIVEYHGGKIWAESDLGRGTTFFFRIPSNIEQ
jgi:signal transduction histidine kinase